MTPARLDRFSATAADLPPAVAAALARPGPGRELAVPAGGYDWRAIEWGDAAHPPLLLVHGVTSNAETFWRVGPAVAAAGRRVVAVDLPGHGLTGGWQGRYRLAETAVDVAEFCEAAGLARPGLTVIGHSWGAMVAAALPAAGLRPERLILLDPPVLTRAGLEQLTQDPSEQPLSSLAEASELIGRLNPDWSPGDVHAKAQGLTQFEPAAVLAVLLDNGDWDGGLAALADPSAAGVPTWVIRGIPAAGGLTAETAVPAFVARLGPDHVITIAGAPHSPQRTHPEATIAAILRALA